MTKLTIEVECFALCGGVGVISVHPSVDEAIALSGCEVKRQSTTGAVLKSHNSHAPDGDNGGCYVTPIFISPSEMFDGRWCQTDTEGGQLSSSYFEEQEWMLNA